MAKTTFLVAVDGSEGSRRAARFAADRARASGASLHLLHVISWSPYEVLTPREIEGRSAEREQELQEVRRTLLAPLSDEIGQGLEVTGEVRHGHPAEVVCQVAGEVGATQVFAGRRGRSKVKALLFGSVTGNLVQTCPVPLTVVP